MRKRDEDEKCEFCDRVWGVFGVATGALVFLIGMDLLSGGFISRLVGKPVAGIDSDSLTDGIEEEFYDEESDDE